MSPEQVNVTESYHDFAAKDRFGRSIGAHAKTYEVVIDDAEDSLWDRKVGRHLPVGRYFAFRPSATRNGRKYGALQYTQYFDTAEARDKAVIKYLRGAQTRAEKNVPRCDHATAATPIQTDPYESDVNGKIRKIRYCEACLQNLADDI